MNEGDARTAFRQAAAEVALGRRPVEEMPAVATDALSGGLESPTLITLAGMDGASWSELRPVFDRAVNEIGGALSKDEAKILVADAWLARLVTADLWAGSSYEHELTGDILLDLGGEYEWFRLAFCDLEVLEALHNPNDLEDARQEVHQRATRALEMTVEQRLGARPPTLEERPFLTRLLGIRPLGSGDA